MRPLLAAVALVTASCSQVPPAAIGHGPQPLGSEGRGPVGSNCQVSCLQLPSDPSTTTGPLPPTSTTLGPFPPASTTTGRTALVSWYDDEPTASGAPMVPGGLTTAHRTLAFGTRVTLCTDRCVTVMVTDRGPFCCGREFDLSPAGFAVLAPLDKGEVVATWREA